MLQFEQNYVARAYVEYRRKRSLVFICLSCEHTNTDAYRIE